MRRTPGVPEPDHTKRMLVILVIGMLVIGLIIGLGVGYGVTAP